MTAVDTADTAQAAPVLPTSLSQRPGLRARLGRFFKGTSSTPGKMTAFTLLALIVAIAAVVGGMAAIAYRRGVTLSRRAVRVASC